MKPTTAMPSAPGSSAHTSSSGTDGTANVGNADGRSPTTATPCAAQSNTHASAVATATATSTPGTFGARRRSTRIAAKHPAPIAAVGQWISSRRRKASAKRGSARSPSTAMPVSFESWLEASVIPTPARYPTRIGRESKDETIDSRRRRAASATRPTRTASAAISSA